MRLLATPAGPGPVGAAQANEQSGVMRRGRELGQDAGHLMSQELQEVASVERVPSHGATVLGFNIVVTRHAAALAAHCRVQA